MSVYYNVASKSALFKDSFDPEKYSLKIQWLDGELSLVATQDNTDNTTRIEIMFDEDDYGALLGILMKMKGE